MVPLAVPGESEDQECANFLNLDMALPNKLGDIGPNVFCRFLEMYVFVVKFLPPSLHFSSSLHLPVLLCVYIYVSLYVCMCVAQNNNIYACTEQSLNCDK